MTCAIMKRQDVCKIKAIGYTAYWMTGLVSGEVSDTWNAPHPRGWLGFLQREREPRRWELFARVPTGDACCEH